jgi:hypothetical protein
MPKGHAMSEAMKGTDLGAAGPRVERARDRSTTGPRPEHGQDVVRADPSWEARVAAHTIPRELRIADAYDPDFERFATVRVHTLLLLGGDSPSFLVDPTRRLHESISESQLTVMPATRTSR